MACFATPFGLRYAAHCFNRAHAQQRGPTLIPTGVKNGVTSGSTDDPEVEKAWFQKKVLRKATSQIRDSLRYLNENPEVEVTNQLGHKFKIESDKILTITKIIIFLASESLPEECWKKRFHISQTTGAFIHVIAAHDYFGVLEKLRVPEDIARYFEYRELVVPKLGGNASIEESDIMGAFLTEEDVPRTQSRAALRHLLQDFEKFDLSRLLADIREHIQTCENPYDYYGILREFAKTPRSMWRAVKERLIKSLEVTAQNRFAQLFRVTFPESDCTFMIAPLDPGLPATGSEGERIRIRGLSNLTAGAKYLAKTSRSVGLLISRDGEYVQIDWCLMDFPWEHHAETEALLAQSNPFRAVSEKLVDGFYFIDLP